MAARRQFIRLGATAGCGALFIGVSGKIAKQFRLRVDLKELAIEMEVMTPGMAHKGSRFYEVAGQTIFPVIDSWNQSEACYEHAGKYCILVGPINRQDEVDYKRVFFSLNDSHESVIGNIVAAYGG